MSLEIRYLTNGTENVYVVVDSASRPVSVSYYDTRDEIPVQIRHYAPEGTPMFVAPDEARLFFAMKVLYPELMCEYCRKPGYSGAVCIFESCVEPWKTCKYRYTGSGA